MTAKTSNTDILAVRSRQSLAQRLARLITTWEAGSVATYLFAIAVIAAATIMRALFGFLTTDMVSSYATYYPAIILVTLIGGAATGAFALALSGVISLIIFVPPLYSIHLSAGDAVSLALFVVSGSFVIAMSAVTRSLIVGRAAELAAAQPLAAMSGLNPSGNSDEPSAEGETRGKPSFEDEQFWQTEVEGQTVLIDRNGGQVIVLNPSGAVCWEVFRGGGTERAAAQLLAKQFGISDAVAERDARAFWARLQPVAGSDVPDATEEVTAHRVVFGAHRFDIECASSALDDAIEGLFRPLMREGDAAAAEFVFGIYEQGVDFILTCDGDELTRERSADKLLGVLISEMMDRAYPQAEWSSVVHAGAVGWSTGCVMIPAPSGRGKSTLVAGLVDSGFEFLSDDSAPIDALTGQVMPVPLALAVKESGRLALMSRYPGLAGQRVRAFAGGPRRFLNLSQKTAKSGRLLRVIVVPHYSPNETGAVTRLSPLAALSALTDAGCWISPDPKRGSRFFDLLKSTPAFLVRYASLDEGVNLVRQTIGEHKSEVRS